MVRLWPVTSITRDAADVAVDHDERLPGGVVHAQPCGGAPKRTCIESGPVDARVACWRSAHRKAHIASLRLRPRPGPKGTMSTDAEHEAALDPSTGVPDVAAFARMAALAAL